MSETQKNPIIERLESFIAATRMTNSQFADRAGIPRPTLSQILHGRNKSINDGLLRKLDENFPQLNLVWLLFGRGDMLTDSNFEFSEGSDSQNSPKSASQTIGTEKLGDGDSLFSDLYFDDVNQRNDAMRPSSATQTPQKSATAAGADNTESAAEPIPPIAELQDKSSSGNTNAGGKEISSIIVFYTDHSFKTFLPAK